MTDFAVSLMEAGIVLLMRVVCMVIILIIGAGKLGYDFYFKLVDKKEVSFKDADRVIR